MKIGGQQCLNDWFHSVSVHGTYFSKCVHSCLLSSPHARLHARRSLCPVSFYIPNHPRGGYSILPGHREEDPTAGKERPSALQPHWFLLHELPLQNDWAENAEPTRVESAQGMRRSLGRRPGLSSEWTVHGSTPLGSKNKRDA